MSFVKDDQFILVKMADGFVKMVLVRAEVDISFGKFGSVKGKDLIGKPLGYTYEILPNKTLRMVAEEIESEKVDAGGSNDTTANNQNLIDKNSNQSLSREEIESLKASGASGEEIVKKLTDNSATFQTKTEFSKAKYLTKKKIKYMKVFKVIKPTLRTLFEFYYSKHPARIFEMRIDALSLILNISNVRSGSKVLVVDGIQGFMTAAVADRLGENGLIMEIHSKEGHSENVLRQLNPSQKTLDMVHHISWADLFVNIAEEKAELESQKDNPKFRDWKRLSNLLDQVEQVRKILTETKFDALVVASEYEPGTVLQLLVPLLAPSRQFVVFSQYSEALTKCFKEMVSNSVAIGMTLQESWYRIYQVLPGRTHPEMQMTAASGFIFSGTTIVPTKTPQPWFKDLHTLSLKPSLKRKLEEDPSTPDAAGGLVQDLSSSDSGSRENKEPKLEIDGQKS